MVAVTLPATFPVALPTLSVYFVTDFITARRSEGSAAIRLLASGLVGVLLLPSRVFLTLESFHPPTLVLLSFMWK